MVRRIRAAASHRAELLRPLSGPLTPPDAVDSWIGWHQHQTTCVSGSLTSLTDKVLLPTQTVRKAQRQWTTQNGQHGEQEVLSLLSPFFRKPTKRSLQEEHRLFASHP